jgi:histidinol-phosphate aminotransferase
MAKKQSIKQTGRKSAATPLLKHLETLAPYPPGKPIEEVQREFGLKHVVKLASNENPLGPSPRALKAMRTAAEEVNLYPDGGGYYLKQEIARRLGVTPGEIVLGNGSDEITLFLALSYLDHRHSIVTSDLAFVRYRMAAQIKNAKSVLVPMKRFAHDTAGIAGAVSRATRLVFIDNPCNPTGSMVTRRQWERLLAAIPRDVMVVADEAYYEYAKHDPDYPDMPALRKKYPNLIVTRTFSKAYGLAGLRIGYAIARPEIVRDLERVRPPFNTNRIAQAAALAALGDTAHLRKSVATNEKGKRFLVPALEGLGIRCMPTWGNFILVDVSKTGWTGAALNDALLRRGVIVRPMGGYGLHAHLRVSIGLPVENRRLIQALKEILMGAVPRP